MAGPWLSVEQAHHQAASPPDEEYDESEPSLDEIEARMISLHAQLLALVDSLDAWKSLVDLHKSGSKYKSK